LVFGIIIVLITIIIVRTIYLRRCYVEKLKHEPPPTHFVASTEREGPFDIPQFERDLASRFPKEYRGVDNLCKAISFRTIAESPDEHNECYNTIEDLIGWMHQAFPLIFQTLEREPTGELHSLLLHWHGKRADILPILLLAHMDVAPEGDPNAWRHNPYDTIIEDEQGNIVSDEERKTTNETCYVYGRGAIDCKVNAITILQAVENLLESGYVPERDIFIAFGCNEETGMSEFGAAVIAKTLTDRGLRFACILDEGGFIVTDVLKFIDKPLAAVSVGEKSKLILRVSCTLPDGHLSMIQNPTAPGVIGEIAANIENGKDHSGFTKPILDMLDVFGLEAPIKSMMPFVLLNKWLFKPLIKKVLMKSPPTAALVSTIHATQKIHSSDTFNSAWLLVHFRIVGTEARDNIIAWVKDRIPAKYRNCVTIEQTMHCDTNVFSKYGEDVPCWVAMNKSVKAVCPECAVFPNVCSGGTDSRWYQHLSDCTYKFSPLRITSQQMGLMHNTNERISTQNVVRSVLFFEDFIQRINSMEASY